MKHGILIRKNSFWIGAHYSKFNRRLCVNPLPFVTFWFTFAGGKTPRDSRNIEFSKMLEARIIERGQKENA